MLWREFPCIWDKIYEVSRYLIKNCKSAYDHSTTAHSSSTVGSFSFLLTKVPLFWKMNICRSRKDGRKVMTSKTASHCGEIGKPCSFSKAWWDFGGAVWLYYDTENLYHISALLFSHCSTIKQQREGKKLAVYVHRINPFLKPQKIVKRLWQKKREERSSSPFSVAWWKGTLLPLPFMALPFEMKKKKLPTQKLRTQC